MRIALTIHSLDGGGAERVLCHLAQRWAMLGHQVHVITWSAQSSDSIPLSSVSPSSNLQQHGLDLAQPSRNVWQGVLANRRRVRALRAKLRQLQPEVVLSFCDQMNISTLQAARGLGIPVWIAERNDPAEQKLSRLWELWRRATYPQCSGCVVQTVAIADYLSRLIPRQRICVIPNAVEIAASDAQPSEGDLDCGESSDDGGPEGLDCGESSDGKTRLKTILAVGRLSHQKGFDVLLTAWQQTQDELPDWQLRIVGDGPQRLELEQRAAKLARVHFTGWLEQTNAAYAQSQLFVLSSRYEGFPNALLEAMSHALPCIATNCSQAIDELSRSGSAIHTVPIDDSNALAMAIRQLAESAALSASLGCAAQQVSRDYSWDRIGPMWDKILMKGCHEQVQV